MKKAMIIKIGRKTESSHAFIWKDAMRDKRMSLSARGVLSYLLTFSENWEVSITNICNFTTSSKGRVKAALCELRKLGYAELEAVPDPQQSGRWLGRRYVVFDSRDRGADEPKNRRSVERVLKERSVKHQVGMQLNGDRNGHGPHLVKLYAEFTVRNRLHVGMPGSTRGGWTPRVIENWTRVCEDLLEQEDYTKVKSLMLWYFSHHREDYVPDCRTMRRFCARFQDVQRAQHRLGKRNGDDVPVITEVYVD